jgi:hypothetical protein
MADDEQKMGDQEEEDSGSESESETEEEEDTGLTENQNRLLYMISLYTHKAESHDDKDEWIRKPALLVLIYEGIVANVLDYDYAPQSELIGNRRIYLNISQVRQHSKMAVVAAAVRVLPRQACGSGSGSDRAAVASLVS